MLQYILTPSQRYSVGELAQMAIEGGCQWISLNLHGWADPDIRAAIAPDVIDMCRESGVFLTIDDHPELARELGLHGVRLSATFQRENPQQTPLALREDLGPEAVIGVECSDPSAVPALQPADVDFISLPSGFTADHRRAFIASLRDKSRGDFALSIPVVAQGDYTPAEAAEAMIDGCNGVAVALSITDASDPVEAVQTLIDTLSSL